MPDSVVSYDPTMWLPLVGPTRRPESLPGTPATLWCRHFLYRRLQRQALPSLNATMPGSLVGKDSAKPEGSLCMPHTDETRTILGRGSWGETARIAEVLRKETVGGALLLLGTVVALVWVNSPAGDSYTALRDYTIGPRALHLDLSLGTWAADGLLAIFFFVVGLELKREFVAGDLRDPARAALPILAALGGVVVPAGIYVRSTSIPAAGH